MVLDRITITVSYITHIETISCTCMHAYYKASRGQIPMQLPRQCRAEEVEEVAEAIRGPAQS